MIPLGKSLITPIYKPLRPIGRGTTYLGDLSTMFINRLQVLRSLDDPPSIVFDACLKLPVFPKGAMDFRGFHLSDARLVSCRLVVVGRLLQKKIVKLDHFPNFHQEFQVPKMEVLNLVRLFWWWVFPYISLIYSLYRWVPPFWVPEMLGEILSGQKVQNSLNPPF